MQIYLFTINVYKLWMSKNSPDCIDTICIAIKQSRVFTVIEFLIQLYNDKSKQDYLEGVSNVSNISIVNCN